MPSLTISNYPSSAHNLGDQSNYSALSTVLAWFGWQDVSAKIKQAEAEELGHAVQVNEPETGIQVPSWARHLMQVSNTSNTSLPEATTTYCYPAGACNMDAFSNGNQGFTSYGENAGDFLGWTVRGAGDINGDGLADVIAGSYSADGYAGKVYVFFGSEDMHAWSNGILNIEEFMDGRRGFALLGEKPNDNAGYAVSSAGDINKDGIGDLAFSAPGFGNSGKTYFVFGSNATNAWMGGPFNASSFMDGQRGFALLGAPNSGSGVAIANADDINGDGISDFLVAAFQTFTTHVVFGSRNPSAWANGTLNLVNITDGIRAFVIQGTGYITSISGLGDFNGDGLTDFILGYPFANNNTGISCVVFGNSNQSAWGTGKMNLTDLMNGRQGFLLGGEAIDDQSGNSVSGAGDLNADGLADLAIGAPQASNNAGETYVILGTRNSSRWGNGTLPLKSLTDGHHGFVIKGSTSEASATSASNAGDFNGDGISDLMIGAPNPLNIFSPGNTYVVFGSALPDAWGNGKLTFKSFIDGQRGVALQGQPNTQSGYVVSVIGDINGDGAADVIVGAPYPGTSAGRIYVMFGLPAKSLYLTANQMTLAAESIVQLDLSNLALASMNPKVNVSSLSLQLVNVSNGYFVLSTNPSAAITGFSMAELNLVRFVHTGGALAPSYTVVVNPPDLNLALGITSAANITFLGYPPILITNQLTIDQGQTKVLGLGDLGISDQDTQAPGLSFIISNLQHGNITNAGQAVTSFTLQDLQDGKIQFTHDGSANPPSYDVAISDTKTTTTPQAAAVSFHAAPVLNVTEIPLNLNQGQPTTLDALSFYALSASVSSDNLVLETRNVSHGYFVFTKNLNHIVKAFTQYALLTGAIQFVQDGSNEKPSFSVRAFDGHLYSAWISPLIQLTYKPLVLGSIDSQSVTQNVALSFSVPLTLFSDPNGGKLSYTAQQADGSPLPTGLEVNDVLDFSGSMPTLGAFLIQVIASNKRGLNASSNFVLNVEESTLNKTKAVWQTFSGLGSIALAVAAYIWYRKRAAIHRRDNPLANLVRKILNLENYDFTRFDGDTYKTKIDNFVQHLKREYPGFYEELTPEEFKNFAVCMAEILVQQGLVSRSTWYDSLFGILCCINVGRPSKLDLKTFEKQLDDIVDQTIDTWKNEVGYKLAPMGADISIASRTIYVDIEDNQLKYQVSSPNIKDGEVQRGSINAADIGCETLPATFEALQHYQPKIYHLLLANKLVESHEADIKWHYVSPTRRDKCRVFACLQKSPSAILIADIDSSMSSSSSSREPQDYEAARYKTSYSRNKQQTLFGGKKHSDSSGSSQELSEHKVEVATYSEGPA